MRARECATILVAAAGGLALSYALAAIPTTPSPVASTPPASAPPVTPPRAAPTTASRTRKHVDTGVNAGLTRPAKDAHDPGATGPHLSPGGAPASVSTLNVTAYCWTGNRTASGAWPQIGMAAGNRWPFGTRIRVPGVGVVTITDRIGHGSELDIYMGREGCEQRARQFGRQQLRVEVLR